jgi:hypothetical protein
MMLRAKIQTADARRRLNLQGPFAVVTLDPPSDVDERDKLAELVGALSRIADFGGVHENMPVAILIYVHIFLDPRYMIL